MRQHAAGSFIASFGGIVLDIGVDAYQIVGADKMSYFIILIQMPQSQQVNASAEASSPEFRGLTALIIMMMV